MEGYSYDILDQLTQARAAGVDTEYLEYDPSGLPLFRKVGTKGTWYIGTSATVTAEVSSACTGTASCTPTTTPGASVHVLLGGTRIASLRAGNPGAAGTAYDEVLYYHRDQQGSVVGTSLRSGGVDGLAGAKYRYTPFGQLDRVDGVSAATDSELGYTGGLRLGYVPCVVASLTAPQARQLLLLGAYVYHAELKRWLQADTIDGRRFTYTGGDPVNFVDPGGRVAITVGRMRFPNDYMLEMYMNLFYGGSGGMSWNLFNGSQIFDNAVANRIAQIEYTVMMVEQRAAVINNGSVQVLSGLNWVATGPDTQDWVCKDSCPMNPEWAAYLVASGALVDENGKPLMVGWTFNVGLQGGYTWFGASGLAFGGIVVDGKGNWAVYSGVGAGLGLGAGVSGGVGLGFSTGDSVEEFGGRFQNASVSAGAGAAGTVDLYRSPDGKTVGGGFSVGPGLGGSAFTGPTNTWFPYNSSPRMPGRAP
jgi:hypothetical protein